MMSEGRLIEPINPDYVAPVQEIYYEVEVYCRVLESWERVIVEFGTPQTDDFTQAKRVYDTVKESGRKARVFEVHSTRKQMSI